MNLFEKIYFKSKNLQWLFRKSIFADFLHKGVQYYQYFKYKRIAHRQEKERKNRLLGKEDSRYKRLRSLKGAYRGKRCFITCTGPSLTIKDLEMLKGEYVFGMNSICLVHDKTDWKPDFFGIQDEKVFFKVKDTLLATDNGQVFAPYEYLQKMGTPENWVYFPFGWAYHKYDAAYNNKFYSKFSDDCYATVYDGFSITYSIIQIAIYMGFDEIYLLGADCSYLGEKQHFIDHGHVTSPKLAAVMTDRLVVSYSEAKTYAESHGIKIFNATRGGCLEVFTRKRLEEVLAVNEKNKAQS